MIGHSDFYTECRPSAHDIGYRKVLQVLVTCKQSVLVFKKWFWPITYMGEWPNGSHSPSGTPRGWADLWTSIEGRWFNPGVGVVDTKSAVPFVLFIDHPTNLVVPANINTSFSFFSPQLFGMDEEKHLRLISYQPPISFTRPSRNALGHIYWYV